MSEVNLQTSAALGRAQLAIAKQQSPRSPLSGFSGRSARLYLKASSRVAHAVVIATGDCNFGGATQCPLSRQGVSSMATAYITRAGIAAPPTQAAARDRSSDEALIRQVAQRDHSAMRALFARHRVGVYRWLLRLVHDEGVAEDLLSEVFLDAWRHAASFEGRSSVSTWLLAIARNKALSARRRRTDAELDEEQCFQCPRYG